MPNRYTFLVAGIFIGIAPSIQAKESHVSDLELINNSSSAKQNDPLGNRGIVDLPLSTHTNSVGPMISGELFQYGQSPSAFTIQRTINPTLIDGDPQSHANAFVFQDWGVGFLSIMGLSVIALLLRHRYKKRVLTCGYCRNQMICRATQAQSDMREFICLFCGTTAVVPIHDASVQLENSFPQHTKQSTL